MFERFTDRARRVVVLAQEEARLLNHNFIGTEHLLLGLIHEGEGVAATALESLGIGLDSVREQVTEIVGHGKHAQSGHIPFTPRAKKVLELSLREALQLGHNYIGTEHILLGLIREGEGVAAQVLVTLGADLNRVRQQVIRLLHSPGAEEGSSGRLDLLTLSGRRERALLSGLRTRLQEVEQRMAALEQRIGAGPEESDQDQEIARIRIAREAAADAQEYENAARLRDTERELRAAQAARKADWSASHPSLPDLTQTVRQLSDEVGRLRDLITSRGAGQPAEGSERPAEGSEPSAERTDPPASGPTAGEGAA